MACIRTHLISGASAVSLVLRPEDRTRLLSSSLRSFPVLRRFSVPECWAGAQGRIQGRAWGAYAPPPPPFATEQVLNAEVYGALSARSYSDTAHMHLYMNHCFSSVGQLCGSVSHTKADSEGKEAPRNDHTMNVTVQLSNILRGYGGLQRPQKHSHMV